MSDPKIIPVPIESPCEESHGCGLSGCQECCEHEEHDHFVCLDCGKELDPGVFIDRAEYDMDR